MYQGTLINTCNQNVNLQNSLTVSTHLVDGDGETCSGVLFDVLDKDFNVITIDYYDYLNSKVCASEYVDYHTNTLKPNENGEVEVKYRMRRKMVKVEDIDLIDRHPDYRLSSTTRRIPLVNYTDSVRISMGTSETYTLVSIQTAGTQIGISSTLKKVFNDYRYNHFASLDKRKI